MGLRELAIEAYQRESAQEEAAHQAALAQQIADALEAAEVCLRDATRRLFGCEPEMMEVESRTVVVEGMTFHLARYTPDQTWTGAAWRTLGILPTATWSWSLWRDCPDCGQTVESRGFNTLEGLGRVLSAPLGCDCQTRPEEPAPDPLRAEALAAYEARLAEEREAGRAEAEAERAEAAAALIAGCRLSFGREPEAILDGLTIRLGSLTLRSQGWRWDTQAEGEMAWACWALVAPCSRCGLTQRSDSFTELVGLGRVLAAGWTAEEHWDCPNRVAQEPTSLSEQLADLIRKIAREELGVE